MKTKTLAVIDGIGGLIAGIILLCGPLVVSLAVGEALHHKSTAIPTNLNIVLTVIKIVVLLVGILTLVYYKDATQVKPVVGILLTVGGAVALIPFLGWAGGIVVIVGAAMALASLRHFATSAPTQKAQQ